MAARRRPCTHTAPPSGSPRPPSRQRTAVGPAPWASGPARLAKPVALSAPAALSERLASYECSRIPSLRSRRGISPLCLRPGSSQLELRLVQLTRPLVSGGSRPGRMTHRRGDSACLRLPNTRNNRWVHAPRSETSPTISFPQGLVSVSPSSLPGPAHLPERFRPGQQHREQAPRLPGADESESSGRVSCRRTRMHT